MGPDEAGRQQLAGQRGQAFADTADIVGVDTSLQGRCAPRLPARAPSACRVAGHPGSAMVAQTVSQALSGADAAYLHDGQSKYPVPVRIQLPRESARWAWTRLLALPLRAANGKLVPLSELVQVQYGVVDKPLFTKDLLP
jgi:multidrug efflux pump subunit AcrB